MFSCHCFCCCRLMVWGVFIHGCLLHWLGSVTCLRVIKLWLCLIYTPELSHSSQSMSVVWGCLGLGKVLVLDTSWAITTSPPKTLAKIRIFLLSLRIYLLGPWYTLLPLTLNQVIPSSNTEPQRSPFSFPSRKIFDSMYVYPLPSLRLSIVLCTKKYWEKLLHSTLKDHLNHIPGK